MQQAGGAGSRGLGSAMPALHPAAPPTAPVQLDVKVAVAGQIPQHTILFRPCIASQFRQKGDKAVFQAQQRKEPSFLADRSFTPQGHGTAPAPSWHLRRALGNTPPRHTSPLAPR